MVNTPPEFHFAERRGKATAAADHRPPPARVVDTHVHVRMERDMAQISLDAGMVLFFLLFFLSSSLTSA